MKLKRALIELIDYHDEALAEHFAEGKLELESYKEYIELFARSLKETMESREGVAYLLRAAGFQVPPSEINLNPGTALEARARCIRRQFALERFAPKEGNPTSFPPLRKPLVSRNQHARLAPTHADYSDHR